MRPLLRSAGFWCSLLLLVRADVVAQVCRLSVAGLNQERRVTGSISAECPNPIHSAPFGNWGVASNFGPKLNGHQFQGWCHDMRVCDSAGLCLNNCRDGWYEWNSCTTEPLFQAPNCSLYNAGDCTEQVSTMGINVLGTQIVDVPVACPSDSDRNGVLDSGGCKDLRSYSRNNNFMSVYELDPLATDELVQTIYYPDIVVPLLCEILECPPAGSGWVRPVSYDSPPSPAKIFAEMAMVVNSGAFLDSNGVCRPVASSLTAVSAASYQAGVAVAPDSIVSLFGSRLAEVTEVAGTLPLPLRLGGVQVIAIDIQGQRLPIELLLVSPGQINGVLPAQVALGRVTFSVEDATGIRSTGPVQVEAVAPAIFTANSDGKGAPAALAVRVAADGRQTPVSVFSCGAAAGSCVPVPIDLGPPAEQVIISLFTTGIRNRSALSNVQATVGDAPADVLYAGPQSQFPGLDQVNVRIPRIVAGAGSLELRLLVDTKPSNVVTIFVR
jgi:uncharacterized protein (TIGR03437 family)